MKVLLDTNVLVAAFVSHGACHELLEHCLYHHEVLSTEDLLEEFRGALLGKLRFPRSEVRQALQVLRAMVRIVEPKELESPACRDPEDDRGLAAAVGGAASCIVTGDDDLLVLKEYRGIHILSPNQFWRFEES